MCASVNTESQAYKTRPSATYINILLYCLNCTGVYSFSVYSSVGRKKMRASHCTRITRKQILSRDAFSVTSTAAPNQQCTSILIPPAVYRVLAVARSLHFPVLHHTTRASHLQPSSQVISIVAISIIPSSPTIISL